MPPKGENQGLLPLLIHEQKPPIPGGVRGAWFLFRLCSWWFAFSLMMGPLPSVIWPAQIEEIVGPKDKERYNGFVPAFGAAVSLITTPIAGMLSDRCNSSLGRRKPFLIVGSIIAAVSYYFCSTGGDYDTIWVFVGFTMVFQFGANLAAGPYAGMIPDNVNQVQIGKASGFTGLSAALGYLVGYLGTGFFTQDYSFWQVYTFLGGMFVLFSLPTILGFKETPNYEKHPPLTFKTFMYSFYLDPARYKSFYWVILTRLLEQMGYYTVLPFLQYFIQDVIFADEPAESTGHEFYSSLLMGSIVVISLPASIVSGGGFSFWYECFLWAIVALFANIITDRYGRKRLVIVSMSIMTTAVGSLIVVCYVNNVVLLMACAIVFGVGYGSFLAVDWALALDALPEGADAAKDMGIWHMAFVLPQVIAPIIAGQILNVLKDTHSYKFAYSVVFAISCVWFLLGTLFVTPIQLKPKSGEPTLME